MNWKQLFISVMFLLVYLSAKAQVSPDCNTAVPICLSTPTNGGTDGFGIDDFNGSKGSGCLEETITGAIESNSAWYRFKTGASGQLGFNISTNIYEDWDFALYKTTDCGSLGEPIRCNFLDNRKQHAFLGVGEDPTGGVDNKQYDDWLTVAPGEEYYLLINNFSNSNSGFSIQFSGEIFVTDPYTALDCSIVDNLLGSPITACDGETVSLDATSDNVNTYSWYLDNGSGYEIITGQNNATLEVTISGNYRIEVVKTTGTTIISDVQVGFSEMPLAYPVNDDVICSDVDTYDLQKKDSEALGDQSSDDFVVSYYSTLADATEGTSVLSKLLSFDVGVHTIYVRVASARNAKCFDVSQQFELNVVKTPVLDFEDEVFLCDGGLTVSIGEMEALPNHTYSWDSGETTSTISVSEEGTYTLTATHTLAGTSCTNTKTVNVAVGLAPVINTIEIEDFRNNNTVTILADVEGDWEYQLDNGIFQSENTFTNVSEGVHTITINDPKGCGAVMEEIVVAGFPKFFTPNGDGNNDIWEIVGLSHLDDPVVTIYDRYGKLLYQLNETSGGWDGFYEGKPMPSSDYWFKLSYSDASGGRTSAKHINNHFTLRR